MENNENAMSYDPANPRRLQVPGPASVKSVTEDRAGVADQAPVLVNVPGTSSSNKKFVQQAFHPALFSRPRSSSLGSNQLAGIIPADLAQPPEWQRVPNNKKLKLGEVSPPLPIPTQTRNNFTGLPLDPEDDPSPSGIRQNKPPPIVLYGIDDVNELTKLIESVIPTTEFRFKIVNKNLLRLMVNSSDNYKKVIDLIRQKGLIGHTFTRKENKPYRIVIKNLHYTTPHEEIVKEFEKTGNTVRGEIINARFGVEKKPSYTFFVNLEPNANNKHVKGIQYIFHQRIKIEDSRKSKSIVQCHRCQQYGHSKNNCMRPYRCVKCGEGHKTLECPRKDRNTPAKCALCDSDHPANFKGCQVYKIILARKIKRATPYINSNFPKNTTAQFSKPNIAETHSLPKISTTTIDATTYAEKTKSTRNHQTNRQSDNSHRQSDNSHSQHNTTNVRNNSHINSKSDINHSQQSTLVEQILIKQSEKIDQLLQQINSLLGLLTAIIPNLMK